MHVCRQRKYHKAHLGAALLIFLRSDILIQIKKEISASGMECTLSIYPSVLCLSEC